MAICLCFSDISYIVLANVVKWEYKRVFFSKKVAEIFYSFSDGFYLLYFYEF